MTTQRTEDLAIEIEEEEEETKKEGEEAMSLLPQLKPASPLTTKLPLPLSRNFHHP
jgi:hypothetical protein